MKSHSPVLVYPTLKKQGQEHQGKTENDQRQEPQTRIHPTVRCPECLGRGHVEVERQRNINYANGVCRLCRGIGKVRA